MTHAAGHDPEHERFAVTDLIDHVRVLDAEWMAGLDGSERTRQLEARAEVAAYVDELWAHLKSEGRRSVDHPGTYAAVAVIRDLAHHLAYGQPPTQPAEGTI